MSRARWVALVALVTGAGLTGAALGARAHDQEPFPHEAHEGLFPLCAGCHQGVPRGDPARTFPDAALCARCHDGVDQERVEWSPPARPLNNLVFSHPDHEGAAGAAGERLDCAACHQVPDDAPPGAVARHPVENCLSCHTHAADEHYGNADCATCHVPLAATRFSLARIESLPRPESHQDDAFLAELHGPAAEAKLTSCTTCHTRERCTSCHVRADEPEIARMPEAPASMELPEVAASYPVPSSHRDPAFLEAHGGLIGVGSATCTTCHVRDDCTSCHTRDAPRALSAFAPAGSVPAPGVGVARRAPASHASPFFLENHPGLAGADRSSCATCHSEEFCASCHDGPGPSGFHPPNFMAGHPTEAYANRMECATCHNTQAFCRQCHLESGLRSAGRLGSGFHDAEPVWLLRHSQAARQNLESCQSCHSQRDCLQCHSTLGAFKVSPHGREFDARRAWEKNPQICFACHTRNPLGGGP